MSTDPEPDTDSTLSPEEAFAVLGDETRLQILEALGEADGPLSYSDLFDRVDYDDTANFTYHLRQLVGHFVRKTDDGYAPRIAGRRVVEAIYSGVVTERLVVERTPTEMPCMYCGSQTEIAYYDEGVIVYCDECEGGLGSSGPVEDWPIPSDAIIGYVTIPPAGVYDRTPTEMLEAAGIWTVADVQAIVRGVCPRCAASVERSTEVCENHSADGSFCDRCNHRFGVSVSVRCTNCIFSTRSPYPTHALGTLELVEFMASHGIDPFASNAFHLSACEEEILSTDPLEARYTFEADGDAIVLTVEEDLSVGAVSRRDVPDSS